MIMPDGFYVVLDFEVVDSICFDSLKLTRETIALMKRSGDYAASHFDITRYVDGKRSASYPA